MLGVFLQGPEDSIARGCIAERNGKIPEPSPEADPAQCAAPGPFVEILLGPLHQIGEFGCEQFGSWSELRQRYLPGKFVHWTDQLAIVAAKDPVANGAAELEWNGAPVFDGEIGDTASRVEFVGSYDGTGRTDLDTGLAAATVTRARGIGLQCESGQYLSQKKVGTAAGRDEVGMLADPAQTGVLRQWLFHDGSGINEDPESVGCDHSRQDLGQLPQFFPHDFVIIATQGILCDVSPPCIREHLESCRIRLPIVAADRNDTDRLREPGLGMGPAHPVACKITHGSVMAHFEPAA